MSAVEFERERLVRRRGAVGAFYEKGLLFLVRVDAVRSSSWGVEIELQEQKSPGFAPAFQSAFKVSAAWTSFRDRGEVWSALFVGWRIYFNPELVGSLSALANSESHRPGEERGRVLRTALRNHDERRLTRHWN